MNDQIEIEQLIGKVVKTVELSCGLCLTFEDGSILDVNGNDGWGFPTSVDVEVLLPKEE